MKRLGFLLLAVFVAIAFTVSAADAEPKKKCKTKGDNQERSYKGGHGEGYGSGYFDQVMNKLDLSDEQLAEAGKLKLVYKKDTIRQTADIKIAGVELRELLSADTVDMKKVERKVKDIYDMKAELKIYRLKEMENFKKILTPEQKSKFKSGVIRGGDQRGEYKGKRSKGL